MDNITQNLKLINYKIALAAERSGRKPSDINLLAVSKRQSILAIKQLITAGQYRFAESYLQEALGKIRRLAEENIAGLEWHFIGPIQANKTRLIAEHFAWVHSVSSLKIAQRLNEQRPMNLAPLQVCLQVNISQEPNKQGVKLSELLELASLVAKLPRLRLRGLMMIPALAQSMTQDTKPFRLLYQALQLLKLQGIPLDTLSMGMSADFELAIVEGATMVRIGTVLFAKQGDKLI